MWELIDDSGVNDVVVGRYDSHTKAKNALHWKIKEVENNWLDLHYSIREIKD